MSNEDQSEDLLTNQSLPTLLAYDLTSLITVAAAVQKRTAWDASQYSLEVNVQSIPVSIVLPDQDAGDENDDCYLRANYFDIEKNIQLKCAGKKLSKTTVALEHIIAVIGHEALHAIQYSHFKTEQIKTAESLGKAAKNSPNDYAEYLGCSVELPAHAIMIALALRDEDPTNFFTSAKSTAKYGYIKERLCGASKKDSILTTLVEKAKEMHDTLRMADPEEE